jgi:hypothetical protein
MSWVRGIALAVKVRGLTMVIIHPFLALDKFRRDILQTISIYDCVAVFLPAVLFRLGLKLQNPVLVGFFQLILQEMPFSGFYPLFVGHMAPIGYKCVSARDWYFRLWIPREDVDLAGVYPGDITLDEYQLEMAYCHSVPYYERLEIGLSSN